MNCKTLECDEKVQSFIPMVVFLTFNVTYMINSKSIYGHIKTIHYFTWKSESHIFFSLRDQSYSQGSWGSVD